MKFLLVLILLGTMVVFFTVYSFSAYFGGETKYAMPATASPEELAEPVGPPGGGSPRDPSYRPSSNNQAPSSPAPGDFQGPSGPPSILGPNEPPPDQ